MGSLLASNVQLPQQQSLPITPTSNAAFTGIGNLSNTYSGLGGSVLPAAQQTASNLYNNPGAPLATNTSWESAMLGAPAALTGYNAGAGAVGTGGNVTGAGLSLLPYATSIMDTAFDPQQALYGRTLQQVQDQSNVNNAMAGVATSPYGAGLTNQATSNFNIDWQNNLLNRMATGANAAGGLVGTGANVANTGTGITGTGVNMMNQAPTNLIQSAMIPYATYSDIGTGQNTALQQLLGLGTSGANLSNLPIQDLISLLGAQNQTNSVANQQGKLALNQQGQNFNQIGTLGSAGLGLLGMLL